MDAKTALAKYIKQELAKEMEALGERLSASFERRLAEEITTLKSELGNLVEQSLVENLTPPEPAEAFDSTGAIPKRGRMTLFMAPLGRPEPRKHGRKGWECPQCSSIKPARWFENGLCNDCRGVSKKKKEPRVEKCASCGTERHPSNLSTIDRLCLKCEKAGHGPTKVTTIAEAPDPDPTVELQPASLCYLTLPDNQKYPQYYRGMFEGYGVSKWPMVELMQREGLNRDGAKRVLQGWSQQGLAEKLNNNKKSDEEYESWRLTPPGVRITPDIIHSCQRKTGYPDGDLAAQMLTAWWHRGTVTDDYTVYECSYGPHYHIGAPRGAFASRQHQPYFSLKNSALPEVTDNRYAADYED